MKNFWLKVVALWAKIPAKYQQWLKGAEVAVATAVVAAFVAAPASDFATKKGIAEFAAGVASAAYAALRLYLSQSPITALVKKTTRETQTVGDVSHTLETDITTVGGAGVVPSVVVPSLLPIAAASPTVDSITTSRDAATGELTTRVTKL
jgi:hypothetical protein